MKKKRKTRSVLIGSSKRYDWQDALLNIAIKDIERKKVNVSTSQLIRGLCRLSKV